MLPKRLQAKIHNMSPRAQIIYTCDMGIGFLLGTRNGVYEEIGGYYPDWPLFKFMKPAGEEVNRILAVIKDGKLTFDFLKHSSLKNFVDILDKYNKEQNEKEAHIISLNLESSIKEILNFKYEDFYAFIMTTGDNFEINLFETYDQMVNDFIARYELTPWETAYAYDSEWTIERFNRLSKDGIPFYEITEHVDYNEVISEEVN